MVARHHTDCISKDLTKCLYNQMSYNNNYLWVATAEVYIHQVGFWMTVNIVLLIYSSI